VSGIPFYGSRGKEILNSSGKDVILVTISMERGEGGCLRGGEALSLRKKKKGPDLGKKRGFVFTRMVLLLMKKDRKNRKGFYLKEGKKSSSEDSEEKKGREKRLI